MEFPAGMQRSERLTPGGVYTAPQILPSPPSISLAAASVADPSKSGAATITITSSFSLAVTGPSTVTAGGNATYAAALTAPANSNPSRVISWSVSGTGCAGAACGTISPGGVYAAPSIPPSPATVQIIATPQADPSKAASISVSILPAIHVSISPSAATVAPGSAQAFQAIVTGAADATVTWDVNGVVGGNATVGSILNSQTDPDSTTYSAPLTPPPGGSVTVHARSNADPSVSASATISFTASIYLTLMPASATLAVSHTQTFSVQVNNTPNQNVDVAGQRAPGRKFRDRPDLRNWFGPVPAGVGQQRRERRLCCARRSAISRSGHHHGQRARQAATRAPRRASRSSPTLSSAFSREAWRWPARGSNDSPRA